MDRAEELRKNDRQPPPKPPGTLRDPLWRLRHNYAQGFACATSPAGLFNFTPTFGVLAQTPVEGFFADHKRRPASARPSFSSLVESRSPLIASALRTNSTPKGPSSGPQNSKRVLALFQSEEGSVLRSIQLAKQKRGLEKDRQAFEANHQVEGW